MKHTKGEWKITQDGTQIYTGDNPTNVKVMCDICTRTEESKANTKLIAAAPDLLKTLIEINKYAGVSPDRFSDHIDSIHIISKEAIKKATE